MDESNEPAENTYEYACMRAELLGLSQPSREEFNAMQEERRLSHPTVDDDAIDGNMEEIDLKGEQLKNASGGLDELNNILSITQKKLNSFKGACGSLTNLLRIKAGYGGSSEMMNKGDDDDITTNHGNVTNVSMGTGSQKSEDMGEALHSQVDRLDSMLDKVENAQYSMSQQNKQIRSFLQ